MRSCVLPSSVLFAFNIWNKTMARWWRNRPPSRRRQRVRHRRDLIEALKRENAKNLTHKWDQVEAVARANSSLYKKLDRPITLRLERVQS